jgi:branched-chain amino acid transport system permease protein
MKVKILFILIILSILAFLPLRLSAFYIDLLSLALIYGIFAMSLDILLGFSGLPSLGHAAFFGISAYAVGLSNVNKIFNEGGSQFIMELLVALGCTAALAIIFGLLILRSRGIYFLMLTLALSMLLWGIAYKWYGFTGGSDGLSGIRRPALSAVGLNLSRPIGYYYFVLIFFIISVACMYYITIKSSLGRVLKGIKVNEIKMQTIGYNVLLYLNIGHFFSALFAGLSGYLYVYLNNFVSPTNLHIMNSAQVLLMTILGGAGTLFGPLIGVIIITFLHDFITNYTTHWSLILGIIYVLVVIFIPDGIYNLLNFQNIYQKTKSIIKLNELVIKKSNRS